VPSDDELQQHFGVIDIGSGDSGESNSSGYTLHHTTTNQQEVSSSSHLTIERVCDEIKVEEQEAEEDNMKLKMDNQLQLCEDFFEEHRFELDKDTLNKENQWLIIEHKKLINEYNDLKERYTEVVAENTEWMQKYESLRNWAIVNFGAESYCDKIYQNLHDAAEIGSMKACRALIN